MKTKQQRGGKGSEGLPAVSHESRIQIIGQARMHIRAGGWYLHLHLHLHLPMYSYVPETMAIASSSCRISFFESLVFTQKRSSK